MKLKFGTFAFACGLSALSACVGQDDAMTSSNSRPARDGNIAIQQEYDAAVEANTTKALELFIARHPDHPLTESAIEELNKISE